MDVTNSTKDFVKGSVVNITERDYTIATSGGPVKATYIGTLKWRPQNGARTNTINIRFGLYVPGFPLKLVSGEG